MSLFYSFTCYSTVCRALFLTNEIHMKKTLILRFPTSCLSSSTSFFFFSHFLCFVFKTPREFTTIIFKTENEVIVMNNHFPPHCAEQLPKQSRSSHLKQCNLKSSTRQAPHLRFLFNTAGYHYHLTTTKKKRERKRKIPTLI